VFGLVASPQLNGRTGTVVGLSEESGRSRVRLDDEISDEADEQANDEANQKVYSRANGNVAEVAGGGAESGPAGAVRGGNGKEASGKVKAPGTARVLEVKHENLRLRAVDLPPPPGCGVK